MLLGGLVMRSERRNHLGNGRLLSLSEVSEREVKRLLAPAAMAADHTAAQPRAGGVSIERYLDLFIGDDARIAADGSPTLAEIDHDGPNRLTKARPSYEREHVLGRVARRGADREVPPRFG